MSCEENVRGNQPGIISSCNITEVYYCFLKKQKSQQSIWIVQLSLFVLYLRYF